MEFHDELICQAWNSTGEILFIGTENGCVKVNLAMDTREMFGNETAICKIFTTIVEGVEYVINIHHDGQIMIFLSDTLLQEHNVRLPFRVKDGSVGGDILVLLTHDDNIQIFILDRLILNKENEAYRKAKSELMGPLLTVEVLEENTFMYSSVEGRVCIRHFEENQTEPDHRNNFIF